MESINQALFLWLNAPEDPHPFLLAAAHFFAEYAIWVVPLLIGVGWLRGSEHTRKVLLEATASGLAGLLINQIVGSLWQHPRPFMIGLGNTFMTHAPDSSFPSDHLTLLWAVAFSLLMHRSPRSAGIALGILGLPMAWARIYLGVHFPLDMLGAISVAALSAWLTLREARWYLEPGYRIASNIHRRLFVSLISLGWVRK
jgi:undecaprenyl-diphosphatase